MDYYQKYQKYKFKYLNLLNQSGGEKYTEKDFVLLDKYKNKYEYVIQQKLDTSEIRALFELINEKGFLKDKNEINKSGEAILLEDNITAENIHITKAVLIGKNVHDVNSILNSMKKKMYFDHFTREPFKLTNLLDVINKLNVVNDKNYIINYIISTFDYEIQIILNSLNEEQKKILFSKNKIDILLTFGINILINVLNNYKYLLSYTNSEDVILTAINKNYKAFILVPENKQTHRICLEVVKIKGFVLEFVPEYRKNYEICLNAVENDGFALQFVPKKINNFAICTKAVQTNSHALQFVLTDKMSEEEYLHICELALNKVNLTNEEIYNLSLQAVKNCGSALQYVLPTKMTTDKYLHICTIAVQINSNALQYVDKNNMLEDKYYKICISAFENNALALQYVDKNNMLEDEYYKICSFAVRENPLALQYVDKIILSKSKYYEICKLALQYLVPNNKIKPEEIYEIYKICKLAVEYDSKLLYFVPKEKLSNLQQFLLLKIVNPNLKFDKK